MRPHVIGEVRDKVQRGQNTATKAAVICILDELREEVHFMIHQIIGENAKRAFQHCPYARVSAKFLRPNAIKETFTRASHSRAFNHLRSRAHLQRRCVSSNGCGYSAAPVIKHGSLC